MAPLVHLLKTIEGGSLETNEVPDTLFSDLLSGLTGIRSEIAGAGPTDVDSRQRRAACMASLQR